jgi:hypothetical protein
MIGHKFIEGATGEEWEVKSLIPEYEVFAGEWNCVELSSGDDGIFSTAQIEGCQPAAPKKALDIQIGGNHYKDMPIQPMEYSMKNGLDACQHTIIKYVTRFREKGGIEDLEKAKHCIDLLIGFEKEKE